jgi:hypothetical protein
MKNMPEIKSAAHALRESKKLKAIWSEESRLTQRILIYIAKLLEARRPRGPGRAKW